MNISVFGLGYVGIVLAACLADNNHTVIGVDVNQAKVKQVNNGQSPIMEDGIGDLIRKVVSSGRLRAVSSANEAIRESTVSFICVGTPSRPNGNIELTYLERVCEEIGATLADKSDYHLVVARSTMLPGSMEDIVIPIIERASGKKAGKDFGICFNPEFLREGTSIKDFYDPPYTIISGIDERSCKTLADLYSMLSAPLYQVPIKTAEMLKYANNAFHALKVTFANEIGNICKQQKIDSHQVMDLVCNDTKLNLSSYYMKSGFAFGGSCLPKDLRAILYHAHQLDLNLPVLESILQSNEKQIDIAFEMIRKTGLKRIGVLGFSFKGGTDDLRESPMVNLIERLIGKGYDVMVYDKYVSLASIQGANRIYLEMTIPHIASHMIESLDEVIGKSELVVIGNKSPEYINVLNSLRNNQVIIDLVRVVKEPIPSNQQYHGICW